MRRPAPDSRLGALGRRIELEASVTQRVLVAARTRVRGAEACILEPGFLGPAC